MSQSDIYIEQLRKQQKQKKIEEKIKRTQQNRNNRKLYNKLFYFVDEGKGNPEKYLSWLCERRRQAEKEIGEIKEDLQKISERFERIKLGLVPERQASKELNQMQQYCQRNANREERLDEEIMTIKILMIIIEKLVKKKLISILQQKASNP